MKKKKKCRLLIVRELLLKLLNKELLMLLMILSKKNKKQAIVRKNNAFPITFGMNLIVKKANDSIKIIYVVNETIATMLTARINTPRYKNLPPKIKAIAAGAT